MMKCEQIQPLMLTYLDDEESPSERTVIQAHLAACQACQREMESLAILRHQLRNHLHDQVDAVSPPEQVWERLQSRLQKEAPTRRPITPEFKLSHLFSFFEGTTPMKKFALIAAIVLVLALSLTAFIPTVRGQVAGAIQKVALGAYTWAVRVETQDRGVSRPLPTDMWIIRTEIGNYAGNTPPGVDPTVRFVESLVEAQALVDFQLLTPAELPQGYALEEVKLAPIGGTHWAFLIYSGPGHDMYVVQMPVGPQPSDKPDQAVSVGVGIMTDGALEEVDFDGKPAVWVEGHSLSWEADGIQYTVGGLDLSLDQAMQIARSLR